MASGREGDMPATCPTGRLPMRCRRESGLGEALCSSHPPPGPDTCTYSSQASPLNWDPGNRTHSDVLNLRGFPLNWDSS